MDPLSIAGLGVGIISGLFGGGRRKAKREMEAVLQKDPRYKTSPIAQERYDYAKTILNARMPGAATAERNMMASQAGQLANINRGATDASQALMLASGVQGETNQGFQNLAVQEGQDYYNRLQNLTGAQQGMIAEGDKKYQDDIRRWENMAKAAGVNIQNRANQWNSLSNLGFGVANFGLSGGFNNIFGAGGTVPGATTASNQANRYLPYSQVQGPVKI